MLKSDDVSSVGNKKPGQKYDCYDSSLVSFMDHLFINIITVKTFLKVSQNQILVLFKIQSFSFI